MGSFVKGLVLGAVVGAAAAVLLSPRAGKQTRELARQRIQGALDASRQAAHDRAEELRARYRQVIGVVEQE